jgi:hypothetical protein
MKKGGENIPSLFAWYLKLSELHRERPGNQPGINAIASATSGVG